MQQAARQGSRPYAAGLTVPGAAIWEGGGVSINVVPAQACKDRSAACKVMPWSMVQTLP